MVFSATGGALVGVTQDRVARCVVLSSGATGVDELKRLTVLQGTLHDEITSDSVVLEAFEHLAREKLEVKVACIC